MNLRHPSNRTLVRVLRLGGAKRRFVLASAKHSCGACESQKRPASPIVSGVHPILSCSTMLSGLTCFSETHLRKAHPTCHEHRVLGYWIAACCSPSRPVGRCHRGPRTETLGCDHTEGPASLSSISNAACALTFLAEKVESDGTQLEVTSLEAPWRNGETERAGKDWKEDHHKMTQDGPKHSGRVFRRQAGELTQEWSMTRRRLAVQASLALDHKRRWKRALHHAAKHNQGELHVGQPLGFWRRGATAAKKPTNAFWHPGVVISITLVTVWFATAVPLSSVHDPKCDRFTRMMRRPTNKSRRAHDKTGRTTTARRRLPVRRHH